MKNLLAANPFGTIAAPAEISQFGTTGSMALGKIVQMIIWLIVIGGAIYALFNFILAGYAFMSAGDDSKAVAGAWAKIYQTAIGLAFMAGAFALAAIFGQLIFGSATFILKPIIPTL